MSIWGRLFGRKPKPAPRTNHPDWRPIPPEAKYWCPENRVFTGENAELRCMHCGYVEPFSPNCPFCGAAHRLLATGTGLPGVLCASCKEDSISWKCPKCDNTTRMHFALYYDSSTVR
jgi:hypothetical protein